MNIFCELLHKLSDYVHVFLFRGDVVIAKSPFDPNMNICKRVIGLEGDKVCTSSPSDLFKAHTYVSMFTSYEPIFIRSVVLSSCFTYTSCDYLLYQGRLLVVESLWKVKRCSEIENEWSSVYNKILDSLFHPEMTNRISMHNAKPSLSLSLVFFVCVYVCALSL